MGRDDGAMPMYAKLPGDYEPCEACAEGRVLVVEVEPPESGDTVDRIVPSGVAAMVPDEVVSQWLQPEQAERVLKARVMCVDHEIVHMLGLDRKAEEGEDA